VRNVPLESCFIKYRNDTLVILRSISRIADVDSGFEAYSLFGWESHEVPGVKVEDFT